MAISKIKIYYPNGILGEYSLVHDEEKNIFNKSYYLSGNMEYESIRLKNNTQRIYFYNNNEKNNLSRGFYINGSLYKKELQFACDGSLTMDISYKNTRKDGRVFGYHENGILSYSINYKDGYEDGMFYTYYTNGALAKKSFFRNGIHYNEEIYR